MVSSTNFESVAANNVALQHYGQKVVYGHVMTNSSRRILIQITVDVMSVNCDPLLSTSALKRRGVTIIFNHDYDRIIFRNETVHLISHECHSYLHITLASGIPPREAMVMAGENAANDVNEEVYGNDGAERHEAQEQLVIDEQSTMRIKRDSLTFLVKRKLLERYVLLNHPQTLRGWHTTRHTFHSQIGAHSVLRVADEVLRTDEL